MIELLYDNNPHIYTTRIPIVPHYTNVTWSAYISSQFRHYRHCDTVHCCNDERTEPEATYRKSFTGEFSRTQTPTQDISLFNPLMSNKRFPFRMSLGIGDECEQTESLI